jgi:hypothetical protein
MLFCWMPLAMAGAFLTGFMVSLMTPGRGFPGYLKRQGIALGFVAAFFGIGAAISYATADHPPLIENKNLALDIEVRVPAKGRTVEQLQAEEFDCALTVSDSDRSYCDMRWSDAKAEGEFISVRAYATLNSRNANREITAGVRDESRQRFHVMLPPSPRKIDEA